MMFQQDHVKAGHCSAFLDFLKESKLLIVYGRVTPEFDNYTSIAARGSAVVDYILTTQETFSACSVMKVRPVSDLVEQYNLRGLIGECCKPPDHALLYSEFKFNKSHEIALSDNYANNQKNQNTVDNAQVPQET